MGYDRSVAKQQDLGHYPYLQKSKGLESVRIISARKATKHEEKQYSERRG